MSTSSFDKYETKYCSLCDEYFYSKALLHQHIQGSSRHPRCETCKHSYLNMIAFRNHYMYHGKYHYCRLCEKHFASVTGLDPHMGQYLVHNDDFDDSYDSDVEDNRLPEGWEDEAARRHNAAGRGNQNSKASYDVEPALLKLHRRLEITDFMTSRMRANSAAADTYIHARGLRLLIMHRIGCQDQWGMPYLSERGCDSPWV